MEVVLPEGIRVGDESWGPIAMHPSCKITRTLSTDPVSQENGNYFDFKRVNLFWTKHTQHDTFNGICLCLARLLMFTCFPKMPAGRIEIPRSVYAEPCAPPAH